MTQKLKNIFSPYQSSYIFPCFMENEIPQCYDPKIVNRITGTEITLPNSVKVDSPSGTITIHDIPDYMAIQNVEQKDIKLKRVTQYKGFLVDLSKYSLATDYLNENISRRNRKNLRSKKKKLEAAHKISYKMHYGSISKSHYDFLFDAFYNLLKNRFDEKKMYNKNLIKWNYYHELVYPLIQNKKASLFVIYSDEQPILLTMNFHLSDIVFSFMQTYDIAYAQYNLGDISMVKHLEWCIANQVKVFDLSIGETDYKKKWCNHSYDFQSHIFYSKNSFSSLIALNVMALKLGLKQYLRDKGIIGKKFQLDKFLYKRKVKKLQGYNWQKS